MGLISDTELVATQQDLIASIVLDTLKAEAKLRGTITDYSAFATPGNKSVSIPKRDTLAAADKAENTPLTAQEMTFSVDTIDLSKKKAILATTELIPEMQSMVNVEAELLIEMSKELALQTDKDIITALRAASAAAPDHRILFSNSPTNTLQKDDILEARRLMLIQNVRMDQNWYIGIHPDKEKDLLGISDFIRNDSYGSAEGLISGVVGKVFNYNVVVHTEFAADECVFWHKSAVGYASQLEPAFMEDDDLENVAKKRLLYMVYGVKTMDSGKRQVLVNTTGA